MPETDKIAREAEAAVRDQASHPYPGPGTELATFAPGELAKLLGAETIPVREWALALMDQAEFEETDTEADALSIVRAILLAGTSEEVFAAMNTTSVDDLIGKEPGARSNVLAITDAKPLRSTYEEGPSTFCVFRATDLAQKEQLTVSCGGRAVQAAILAHVLHGWIPFKAVVARRLKPTRAGFYPLNLESGI